MVGVCTLYPDPISISHPHRSILIQAVWNQRRALESPVAGVKHIIIPVPLWFCASIVPLLIILVVAQIFASRHPHRA
jgi:hypothetical protein